MLFSHAHTHIFNQVWLKTPLRDNVGVSMNDLPVHFRPFLAFCLLPLALVRCRTAMDISWALMTRPYHFNFLIYFLSVSSFVSVKNIVKQLSFTS